VNNKLIVLEDNPLVIMLYELWCKRFGISLLLFKRIDQLITDVIKDFTLKSHCFLACDFKNNEADKINLDYKTKIKLLELIETLYITRSSLNKNATF